MADTKRGENGVELYASIASKTLEVAAAVVPGGKLLKTLFTGTFSFLKCPGYFGHHDQTRKALARVASLAGTAAGLANVASRVAASQG